MRMVHDSFFDLTVNFKDLSNDPAQNHSSEYKHLRGHRDFVCNVFRSEMSDTRE